MEGEQTLQAEQALLGAVFLEPSRFDEIVTILHEDDFYAERHNLIFRAMKYVNKQRGAVDTTTIIQTLDKFKKVEQIGGVSYIYELSKSSPTAANIVYYANLVKHKSLKRKGMRLGVDIQRLVDEDEFETAEEFYQMLDSLTMSIRPGNLGRMRSFDDTEDEFSSFLESTEDLVKTGFPTFDEAFGGIGRGWLYILAGRPSVGKTAKSLQMAYNISKQGAGEVLFWSQEMTFNQLKLRILSNLTGIAYSRMRKKMLDQWEKEVVMKAHKETANYPLHVEDSAGITIDHIRATAKQVQRKKGRIGAIFVDYLTRMNIKQEKGQTWSRSVGEVAKRFKWLAQELDCPVILLAQLNREGAEGAPSMHHLRDSGEIEQEADVIEFLWRDNDEQRNGQDIIVNSTIAKGRDTGLMQFQYKFKGWIQRYEEIGHAPSVVHSSSNRKNAGSRNRPA